LGVNWALAVAALGLFTACAPKPPVLPSGVGTPFPDLRSAYRQATAACSAIKTITLTANLSGRAGKTKLRGRVDAGFEAPARARLEGIAPFGKPVFVLVADGMRGTLVLPRDDRVLADAPPDRIVEALAGVPIGAETLRTIVSGCGFGGASAGDDGQKYANGWVGARTLDGAAVFLRQAGSAWQIAAAARAPLSVFYTYDPAGKPASIRIRTDETGGAAADVTLRLSDVETNTALDPRTFDIRPDLPTKPIPLTLDELRRAGPLGGS